MEDKWIRTGDAARILSVSPPTVRKLCLQGRLAFRVSEIGKRWWISERSCRDYVKGTERVARLLVEQYHHD